MRNTIFAVLLLLSSQLPAQLTDSTYLATIQESELTDGRLQFQAQLPAQQPIAGAPPPFYMYHWEFGDGHFSNEAEPVHRYRTAGRYDVQLFATGGYDDGKPPTSRPTGVAARSGGDEQGGSTPWREELATVLDEEQPDIRLHNIRDPKPDEELVLVLSYRNPTSQNISGELNLFFNEKSYPEQHFTFKEGRTHFGEEEVKAAYSLLDRGISPGLAVDDWNYGFTDNWINPNIQTSIIPQEILDTYQDNVSWNTGFMIPGETRNLFISLDATPEMLKDTHAIVTVDAYFLPDQPGVAGFSHRLELEIVASHDPNHISVRNARLNYRYASRRPQEYKIRFQNTGEGPASTVKIVTTVDDEFDPNSLEIIDNYPVCPLCPEGLGEAATYSCLDTIRRRGELEFIFRNIYLPGTRQDNVSDRDSTKGHVRYRIAPERRLPKVRNRNQAAIYFDRNPPIYTNFSGARFKPGISPGIYLGRRTSLPAGEVEGLTRTTIGLVVAPYSAYRPYFQAEVYAGLAERMDFSQTIEGSVSSSETVILENPINPDLRIRVSRDSVLADYSLTSSNSVSSIALVPLQIRYALNSFVGLGAGAHLELLRRETSTSGLQAVSVITTEQFGFINPAGEFIQEGNSVVTTEELSPIDLNTNTTSTDLQGHLFLDLQLGRVRTWPVVGVRYHQRVIGDGDNFYSVYIGGKF
ncbi:MAG: PKD domain-containing protein [Bacteroidota bacterium]